MLLRGCAEEGLKMVLKPFELECIGGRVLGLLKLDCGSVGIAWQRRSRARVSAGASASQTSQGVSFEKQ